MWFWIAIGCAPACEPGFLSQDGACYWVEDPTQDTLRALLSVPLPDPLTVLERFESWMQHSDESCPGGLDGTWDTEGCTTESGVHFTGKALVFRHTDPDPAPGEMALDTSMVSAATLRVGTEQLEAGGIASFHANRVEEGFEIRAATTGDFFESPAQVPWMQPGLGQSLYAILWTAPDHMELDGGVSHPHGELYFDHVAVDGDCARGTVLVHSGGERHWTELDWDCDCGVVTSGASAGVEICAPLSERSAELSDTLQAPL